MSSAASVESHNPKIAPTLTPGKVTPEVLHQWERACKEFFRIKGIAKENQVESVLSRLQDLRTADWVEANEAVLTALAFPDFMERLRGEVLERDWDRKIKLSVLASKQGERPFHEWANGMQTRNALLRGRPHHFNDEALREVLENNMDTGLELRIRRIALATTVPLREWIETVRVEDEFLAGERKETKEMARKMARKILAEQRTLRGITNIASGSTRPVGVGGPNNPAAQRPLPTAALPKLTPVERMILFDHQGCFKCRQLYVDHKGADCPNGFPAPGSYKPLTTAYAEAVRDNKNKPRPRMAAHAGFSEVDVSRWTFERISHAERYTHMSRHRVKVNHILVVYKECA